MSKNAIIGSTITGIVILMSILVACSPADSSSFAMQNTPALTQSPTLFPPYMATQQAAYVDSQATQMAGEAQMQILSVQGTQVALNILQAAVTATTVQQQLNGIATATAAIYQTQVAGVQQTAVAGTQAVETQAAQTREAYIVGLTTMTPAAATAQAIGRQGESDQQAQWFTTWAYRISFVIIFAVSLAALLFGGRALWDARWAILARLGLVTWGPDGKPYWVAAYKGGVALLDMTRAAEPALLLFSNGNVQSEGGLQDKVAQAHLADHAQVIEHKLAEGTLAAQTKPAPMTDGSVRVTRPPLGQSPQGVPSTGPKLAMPKIVFLPSDDPKAKPWIEDAVKTVLDDSNIINAEARDVVEEYE